MPDKRKRRASDSEHDYTSRGSVWDDESYDRNRRSFRAFLRRIKPTPLPEYRLSRVLTQNNVATSLK